MIDVHDKDSETERAQLSSKKALTLNYVDSNLNSPRVEARIHVPTGKTCTIYRNQSPEYKCIGHIFYSKCNI